MGAAPALTSLAVGCRSGDVQTDAKAGMDLPAELMGQMWPIVLATPEAQGKFVGSSGGWVPLVMNRDLRAAVQQLGASGGLAAARAHAEASAMYREASLMTAYSYIETYGKTPADTDALGTAHLLSVSYALVGDLANARAQSKRLEGSSDPTLPWHRPWAQWLASPSPVWPPDLSTLPVPLPARTAGEWPEIEGMPHYTLPEGGGSALQLADPGALVALALWHAEVARTAAGDKSSAIDTFGARHLWKLEARPSGADLPMELLFGSDFLVPADGAFLAEVTGGAGAAAVDASVASFRARSVVAAMADRARVSGRIDPERAVDLAAELRKVVSGEMKKLNGGNDEASHRRFASIAEVCALRGLALVAEAEGNREVSGILRINAMEKSDGPTACPSGLLSLAAWDASNRYPARGSDILHQLIRRYPSLEAARYGLDVLALRVSRERPQLPPGM